jgi:pimeloyl-ACP methyl ester carboxylesterase
MSGHHAMARPGRVERLALLAPVGLVCNQHAKWLTMMTYNILLRPTVTRTKRAMDTFVMERSRAHLRENPWRPIAQQFIDGIPTFRFNLREPRPIRCDIDRLAASDIPVIVVVPRDETLHDGATMAERFRQRLPQARVRLVDDANHLVPIDQPEVVANELQKFLGSP